MSSTSPLARIPAGTGALFFIQIFSTLGFAVLYSTLVLYTTKHLEFSIKHATAVMGVFGAFNYGLHLFGGYLGGRFLSNRNLRSEEHTSELQSLMRISYAVFCLKKKNNNKKKQ